MRYPFSLRRALFDQVCAGVAVERAARELGVSRNTGHNWWYQAGGMKLVDGRGGGGLATSGKPDSAGGRGHRLSLEERTTIMRLRDQAVKPAEIGRRLGRHRSTVARELERNRNADGDYHSGMAHGRAAARASRPKGFKLQDHPMAAEITDWLDEGWSPKLISRWLTFRFPDDKLRQVSHETIYQCLYVQTRGSLRADLWKQLSTKRAARKPRDRVERRGKPYAEAFTIAQRPASVADRAVPGHWEGDLIVGPSSRSAIGTLVERTTRFTVLLHLPGDHTAETVAQAMINEQTPRPPATQPDLGPGQRADQVPRHPDRAEAAGLLL